MLNTPKMQDDFPGLRSYFASMIGLIAIACRMGRVRNVLPPNSEKRLAESLKAYVHRYAEVLDSMDSEMFQLAGTWKDFERFDFIGDDKELYSALFPWKSLLNAMEFWPITMILKTGVMWVITSRIQKASAQFSLGMSIQLIMEGFRRPSVRRRQSGGQFW